MVKPSRPGAGANRDPKITLMRKALTEATTTHGLGGLPKGNRRRAAPTMPKLKCLESRE